MPDIIKLLPDSVANQIAAGEVIQRPASVVKELLENAIDAGANHIQLILKDAGKTLIQVIDNGSGMSETDARMSLERHATSKITNAQDLFALRTMGFRGEALASIVAIAQMELKTRQPNSELGILIDAEGSKVVRNEPCQMPEGTSIAVKNLFYNVPARRKFLKSNPVETRHIIDEFQRVALINPEIGFSMHHNGNEVFHVEQGGFRQRIVSIFGKNYNQRLVPVEVETNIVRIEGFIGKPEAAKKTRGEQFFFVNGRFIKSNYHHHAVLAAYEELIPKNHHPSYFLQIETDPGSIDINIHPTKTEVKFEDEKAVYAIIRSTVKQSLGKYNIAPSLDFEQENSFNVPLYREGKPIEAPTIKVDTAFNPFDSKPANAPSAQPPKPSVLQQNNRENWQKLFDAEPAEQPETFVGFNDESQAVEGKQLISSDWDQNDLEPTQPKDRLTYQLHHKYILTHIKSGLMVIHQQFAHERVLYEKYRRALAHKPGSSQQLLFPQTLEFPPTDAALVHELLPDLKALGFDLEDFGQHAFILRGIPTHASGLEPKELVEGMLEHFKDHQSELKSASQDNLARALARNTAIRTGKKLASREMENLIDELFACEMPYSSPYGKTTLTTISLDDLEERFM